MCVVVEGTSKINKNSLVKMGPFHDSGVRANGYAMEKVIKGKRGRREDRQLLTLCNWKSEPKR